MTPSPVEYLFAASRGGAIYLVDNSRAFTYRHTCALVDHNASILPHDSNGGGHCAILAENSLEFCVAFWSIIRAGGVAVPINPHFALPELSRVVRQGDVQWVITTRRFRSLGHTVSEHCGAGWVALDSECRLVVLRAPRTAISSRCAPGTQVMLLSSGTCGLPKLVQLTSTNLLTVALGHAKALTLHSADVALIVLPLYHASALVSQLIAHTVLESQIVIFEEPVITPKLICEWLRRFDVTCVAMVPTIVNLLAQYRYLAAHQPETLRYLCCGGDVLGDWAAMRILSSWPEVRLVRTYGLTECATRASYFFMNPAAPPTRSIGTPLDGVTLRLEPVRDGQEEIILRGANVMPGYYAALENDGPSVLQEGWLHTGDLARRGTGGSIEYSGRLKNIIISKGINISPEEVEAALLQHPLIADVVVYGIADFHAGERVAADVVWRDGVGCAPEELRCFLLERVAAYKCPTRVTAVNAIARTATGKALRCRPQH
jgi:long-chain acyl-CoA synthetase